MWALCSILIFESYTCENCGHLSGFRDEDLTFEPMMSLISDREQIEYRYCKTKNTTYVTG
jgi:hypothetical protein